MRINPLSRAVIVLTLFASLVPVANPGLAHPEGPQSGAGGSVLFIENAGQEPPGRHFYTHGASVGLRVGTGGLQITLPSTAIEAQSLAYPEPRARYAPYTNLTPDALTASQSVATPPVGQEITLRFPGARLDPQPFSLAETRINAYPSPDPATWRENAPAWRGVRLANLYPGVDLEITSEGSTLVWRTVCRTASAGACARVQPLLVSETGETAPSGALLAPTGAFGPLWRHDTSRGGATPALALPGAGTLVGGSGSDWVTGVARAAGGAVYVAGTTTSTGEGYTGSLFVAGYTADLGVRTFLTFLGGRAEFDTVADAAVAPDGSVLIAGTTFSHQFPVTPGAFDTVLSDGGTTCPTGPLQEPCPDAFAVKLTPAGQLAYATFLGGSHLYLPGWNESTGGDDYGAGIRGDAAGNLYVVGTTDSQDFPTTPGAYDRTFSHSDLGQNPDIFVAKLRPQGMGAADLLYGTYLGLGYVHWADGIALDADGAVYGTGSVTGDIRIQTYPKIAFPQTAGAYPSPSSCEADACQDVVFYKLNPAGNGSSDLVYSTFFGGTAPASVWYESEYGTSVTVMPDGSAVVGGATYYENAGFPTTTGALIPNFPIGGYRVGFLTHLSLTGQGTSDLRYSTLLGGKNNTEVFAVAPDSAGRIYTTGYTESSDFPITPDALDDTVGARRDAFVTCLVPANTGSGDLVYSSYLGGENVDVGRGLAVIDEEMVVVAGTTESSDFPVAPGGHDTVLNGTSDGFVVALGWGSSDISGRITDAAGLPVSGVTVTATGGHTAVAQIDGTYTLADLAPGTYTLTVPSGYIWEPAYRVVSVPPPATGQDFTRHVLVKSVTPDTYTAPLAVGSRLTYTVAIAFPDAAPRVFYDAIPVHTQYIAGSLVAPGSVAYDLTSNAITGTLAFAPGLPFTVTFAVSSTIAGTPQSAPHITNRACVAPAGQPLSTCTWSNEIATWSYAWRIFLPLTVRQ